MKRTRPTRRAEFHVELELEEMIAEDPGDAARWMVFEDRLLEVEDARSPIILAA